MGNINEISGSLHFLSEDGFEGVGHELVAAALVELVLELHPMQSQGVQETLQCIHTDDNTESSGEEAKPHCPVL